MAPVTRLASIADAEAMLAASQSRPVFLLKHSSMCPVSAFGKVQFLSLDGPDDPPLYSVTVQTARQVSDWLADVLDVRHETPQALLIVAGTAVYAESHGRIRTSALRAAAQAHADLS
ncbi:MAG TPA: bacillithiol system redox-active protein YtxJ [Rubricoccaceae bacterium]|jgi:bacillithiol system protein YtxJ